MSSASYSERFSQSRFFHLCHKYRNCTVLFTRRPTYEGVFRSSMRIDRFFVLIRNGVTDCYRTLYWWSVFSILENTEVEFAVLQKEMHFVRFFVRYLLFRFVRLRSFGSFDDKIERTRTNEDFLGKKSNELKRTTASEASDFFLN